MFPPAGARIYRNEDGEPLGWDNPAYDEPEYDPDDFLDYDGYDDDDYDDGEDEYEDDTQNQIRDRIENGPAPDEHLDREFEEQFDIGDDALEM